MAKHYLLDTGILLSSPNAIFTFAEHDVHITEDTIIELSKRAKRVDETAANAREALRLIAEYIVFPQKTLPGGGYLSVLPRSRYQDQTCVITGATITNALYALNLECGVDYSILVTNDNANRIWASIAGLRVEAYRYEQVAASSDQHRGRRETKVPGELIDLLYTEKRISAKDVDDSGSTFTENEYILLRNETKENQTALCIFRGGHIDLLSAELHAYGITPRKVGQSFALHALLAPVDEIPLVILKGPAGTGKTMLALAAALEMTLNQQRYDRILVSRPNIKFDNDIGYLKGSEEEKIGPLIRPVMDNLEQLCRTKKLVKKGDMVFDNYVQDLFDRGVVVAQAMAYMRGRSIANTFILIDEAQNSSQSQAFGIVSRVGIGAKVVLCGDPDQIDAPELDTRNNGLCYASEMMRGSPLCAQVAFEPEECVRSPLALEAIQRMSQKTR